MTQATGDQAADAGPQPAEPAAPAAAVLDPELALAAYLAHRPGCPVCSRTIWRCAESQNLWDTYRQATGTC